MKKIVSYIVVFLASFALTVGAANAQRPDGISYAVTVQASFGTEFSDCFIFGNDGVLTVLGLGIPQAFDQKNLGESKVFWQSVTYSDFGFSIAFSGMVAGNEKDGMIKGDAVSEFGDTFSFTGRPADCAGFVAASATVAASSPWMQR
jgi:hypothetical protein